MGKEKNYMRSMISGESRAYGFTIAFWGSGALLINEFGAPNLPLALSYGFGAVLGFGMLALALFGRKTEASENQAPLVLSTIHYLSALAPMIFTHYILQTGLEPYMKFALGGMGVSVLYNLLSIVEEDIAELVNRF
ncbi:MAG: hypothetical protein R6V35_00040 [Candidatus Nanohaloarchaea archaeon]